jgi:hypothetical protein
MKLVQWMRKKFDAPCLLASIGSEGEAEVISQREHHSPHNGTRLPDHALDEWVNIVFADLLLMRSEFHEDALFWLLTGAPSCSQKYPP